MIETRLLQYFLAVADEQSITKAAKYLHITQPTLSKQMMALEATLGKQLLVRDKEKVTLTEERRYLRSRAQEIIDLLEITEASFRDSEKMITGDVFIGCGEHRTSFFIMQIIQGIQQNYPEIKFHFFSNNADVIVEQLDKGLLDVGILLEPEISSRYDYQKLPFQETWGVLMRKDSPLAGRSTITLKEISSLPLILPSQTSHNNRIITSLSDETMSPHIIGTYNLIFNSRPNG